MSTSAATIMSNLKTIIEAIVPTVQTGARPTTFLMASQMRTWADRPDDDVDREFTLEHVTDDEQQTFSGSTGALVKGTIKVMVGNSKFSGQYTGAYRRDSDLELLSRKIQSPSLYPADCCSIIKTGQSIQEQAKCWVTTLTFDVIYVGTAIV